MSTKEDILQEIRRTAKENGDVPLGRDRFIKETGITEWEFNKYWPRFSDAQKEAGFKPNILNKAFEEKHLFEKYISVTREIGKIPARGDLRFKRRNDPSFPTEGTFKRFGGKIQFVRKLLEYAKNKNYMDVVELCNVELEKVNSNESDDSKLDSTGSVYLSKSGRYYKIGRTNSMGRRHHEITILLPESFTLVHEIKTDDPSGIEAYWHKRFNEKRKMGEWFDLNSSDVKSFKRWRRII